MFDKRDPEVLVIGAACVDIKGQAYEELTSGTSNRGTVRVSPGGAARNIAENLARLNVRTSLLTVVGTDQNARTDPGGDHQGGRRHQLRARPPGISSGVYLAVMNQTGHLAVSIDEMACLERINPPYIYANRSLIERASMVVLDANLATNALGTALALARRNGVPTCMTTVSVALARKVKRYLAIQYRDRQPGRGEHPRRHADHEHGRGHPRRPSHRGERRRTGRDDPRRPRAGLRHQREQRLTSPPFSATWSTPPGRATPLPRPWSTAT